MTKEAGRPLTELTIPQWEELVGKMAFQVERSIKDRSPVSCPCCGGTDTNKVHQLATTYVRGYGYVDKTGMKNASNLHTMVSGADPYAEHRKPGDARDLAGRLRKKTVYDPHRSNVFL
jgi:hypothetical protein